MHARQGCSSRQHRSPQCRILLSRCSYRGYGKHDVSDILSVRPIALFNLQSVHFLPWMLLRDYIFYYEDQSLPVGTLVYSNSRYDPAKGSKSKNQCIYHEMKCHIARTYTSTRLQLPLTHTLPSTITYQGV